MNSKWTSIIAKMLAHLLTISIKELPVAALLVINDSLAGRLGNLLEIIQLLQKAQVLVRAPR